MGTRRSTPRTGGRRRKGLGRQGHRLTDCDPDIRGTEDQSRKPRVESERHVSPRERIGRGGGVVEGCGGESRPPVPERGFRVRRREREDRWCTLVTVRVEILGGRRGRRDGPESSGTTEIGPGVGGVPGRRWSESGTTTGIVLSEDDSWEATGGRGGLLSDLGKTSGSPGTSRPVRGRSE